MYLEEFIFADVNAEETFINNVLSTVYKTYYPFKILTTKQLKKIEFSPITILHGGNGSGKTTVLNIIAEKLKINRSSVFNRTNFFDDYLNFCDYKLENPIPIESKIITSDDVFDYMLNIRYLNNGIHLRREKVFEEYIEKKNSNYKFESLDDYTKLRDRNSAIRLTQSAYVKSNLNENITEKSNGESAYMYFVNQIEKDGLYILDEPENSLSPTKQLELAKYIQDSSRFFNCQFIISTHSPFLLSLNNAKIYNLDKIPATECNWKELDNIKVYAEFFQKHFN